MPEKLHINAFAFQEGGVWIAQGIEYDIVARAPDVMSLQTAFARAVFENICITQHLGRQALQGVKRAPDRFRAMFDAAQTEMHRLKQDGPAEVMMRVA